MRAELRLGHPVSAGVNVHLCGLGGRRHLGWAGRCLCGIGVRRRGSWRFLGQPHDGEPILPHGLQTKSVGCKYPPRDFLWRARSGIDVDLQIRTDERRAEDEGEAGTLQLRERLRQGLSTRDGLGRPRPQ